MKAVQRSRKAALALALAATGVVTALPAAAEAASTSNACRNNVTANNSQIEVDTTGTASPDPVAPGATITLTDLHQEGSVPGSIFVAGYNLGLLSEGENNIPSNILTDIEGTNTVEGVQTSSTESTVVTTTIDDPDNSPGTGDETATPATFDVDYDDMTFTAGPSGLVEFRQDTQAPVLASPEFAETGSLIIRALVGGFFKVRFACSPGTVAGPDPGTVTNIDPAGTFASVNITAASPECFGTSADDLNEIAANGGTAYASDGVTYNSGTNTFTGTSGDDVIIGSDGADIINGGAGDDQICSRGGDDRVHGNKGFDDIDTGDDNDRAWGDNGGDQLLGGLGNDKLVGELGTDTIDGGDGDDTLIGGANDDSVIGGAGTDSADGDNAAPYGPEGTNDVCDAETEVRCEADPI